MYSNNPPVKSGLLNRLWRLLTGARQTKQMIGTQRSAVVSTYRWPTWDQELIEYPIREQEQAKLLISAIYGENREKIFDDVLRYIESDVFSSSDGDDRGFTISETLDDGQTPIDPDVYEIATELIRRKNGDHFVVGGTRFQRAAREAAAYGDSFWQLAIERDGDSYAITDTLKMPCWEMFRVESDTGELLKYEQRRRLFEVSPQFQFPPIKIIHFRYRQRGLYGQSLFSACLTYRADHDRARRNLAKVTNDTGSNPYIFKMPEGTTREQKLQFKEAIDQAFNDGTVTALYPDYGVEVDRLGADVPNFEPLIEDKKTIRHSLVPAGFPVWLIPGMDNTGARDISGGPERAYARMINDFRAMLTTGIRQAIDIELFLKLGPDAYQEKVIEKGYTVTWPKITVLTNQGMPQDIPETDADGIQELESDTNRLRYTDQGSIDTAWLYRVIDNAMSRNGHGR